MTPHLMISTPSYGRQVTALYASSVIQLLNACDQVGLKAEVGLQWGDALISRARQDLVTRFLETPQATHILFIDADIGFTPDQVFRLLKYDVEFAAGVYPLKQLNPEHLRRAQTSSRPIQLSELWNYTVEFENPANVTLKGVFAKAAYAGMGFTLIKRSVFEKMIKAYPELKYTKGALPTDPHKDSQQRYALFNDLIDEKTGHYLSEDRSFCQRWIKLGGEIWVDTQSRLQHVGPTVYNGDFSTQFQKP